jgi:calcineurin-like phosphoesterase family protein
MRYFISDTHFDHKQIIEYDKRPFDSLSEMEWEIINRWNNTVSRNDIVYHLGDFGFGNPKRFEGIVRLLNGHIRLIRGNHDIQNGYTAKKCVFSDGTPMFNDIGDIEVIHIGGIRCVLSHYPYTEERMPQLCPKNIGNVLIHGHSHNFLPKFHENQVNVSCCLWDYTPVSEKEILKLIMENT